MAGVSECGRPSRISIPISSYSPMQAVPTLEALCQAVRAQGQDTLAFTDTNGLSGEGSPSRSR